MKKIITSHGGFSLIELMVTVAIIGVLAAVAIPSYKNYMVEAGRAEGVSLLMDVMSQQEIAYRNKLSYSEDLKDLGYATTRVDSETELYIVRAQKCGTQPFTRCVLLRAVPKSNGRQVGDGPLTLDSRGNKGGEWP